MLRRDCSWFSVSQSPYDCSFESGLCAWTQDNSDNFDWTRAQVVFFVFNTDQFLVYSETYEIRTPLGLTKFNVPISEVSPFQGVHDSQKSCFELE
jgi:hypothetical protein